MTFASIVCNTGSYNFSKPAYYVYISTFFGENRFSSLLSQPRRTAWASVMARKNNRQKIEQDEALSTYADDYHLEDQPGYILRKAHQRSSEIFNEVMKQFDVSPTQFSTLIKLHDFTETSQNRLGRLVAMDPATTLGVVQRLKERGLVEQRKDPSDLRRLLLRLTPEGLEKTKAMRKIARKISEGTFSPLSKTEQNTLLKLLQKIS